jgi:hypothetical protein
MLQGMWQAAVKPSDDTALLFFACNCVLTAVGVLVLIWISVLPVDCPDYAPLLLLTLR